MEQVKPLTVDLDERDFRDLTTIAAFENRSPAEVAAETLRARIERHREFVAAVEEGLAAAREGKVVSHETVLQDMAERRRQRLARHSSD